MFVVKTNNPDEIRTAVFKAAEYLRYDGCAISVTRIERMVGLSGEKLLPYVNEWKTKNGLEISRPRKSNQFRSSRPTARVAVDKKAIFRMADILKSQGIVVTAQAVSNELGYSSTSQVERVLKEWALDDKRQTLHVVDVSKHSKEPFQILALTRDLALKLGWETQKLDSVLTRMKRSEFKTVVEIFEENFADDVAVIGKPWKTYLAS